MKHLILPFIMIFGVILPAEEAVAQTANELVGTWSLVSLTNEQGGTRTDLFGPNPKGILMFDDSGHFCFLSTSGALPKFAVNNRAAGTPEENKAVMQGSMAAFGTYSVDEAKKTFTSHIESSTFPNWNGADQERSYTLTGDELKITNSHAATGAGTNYQVWKRAK